MLSPRPPKEAEPLSRDGWPRREARRHPRLPHRPEPRLEPVPIPTLRTERLFLRAFSLADSPRVRELAGERDVADTTLNLPHPYEEGIAEEWIGGLAPAWEARERLTLAITTESDGLVGAAGLRLVLDHRRAELGYWIGKPYWDRGFATEASRAILGYGFDQLDLHRIVARHFPRNPASGRVMRKLGMAHEGRLREHVVRWGRFEDLECYAILQPEWRERSAHQQPSSPPST